MLSQDRLGEAREFALRHHNDQTDKLGVLYCHHLADVARRVAHLGQPYEIVAWLHDSVEDTGATLSEIEALFGPEVRAGVDAMTKRKGERYVEDYLPRLKSNELAVAVKIADASHNWGKAHLLGDVDPQAAQRLGAKYRTALLALGVDVNRLPLHIVFDNGAWRPLESGPGG